MGLGNITETFRGVAADIRRSIQSLPPGVKPNSGDGRLNWTLRSHPPGTPGGSREDLNGTDPARFKNGELVPDFDHPETFTPDAIETAVESRG